MANYVAVRGLTIDAIKEGPDKRERRRWEIGDSIEPDDFLPRVFASLIARGHVAAVETEASEVEEAPESEYDG